MPDVRRALIDVPGVEVGEPIGRGGFGTVYAGWQPAFRRPVAVKVLDAATTDPETEARFRREVMAMGAVSHHPNVLPVYDAGIAGDRPYLIMPKLSGRSLADELQQGAFEPDHVIDIGVAMADALDAAHRAGLLHRDVKPGNILSDDYGHAVLTDFGIARFADSTSTLGSSAATISYAAPEVLRGEPASPASDVYSLGATLYALLAGQPAVRARDQEVPVALAVRALSEEPASLTDLGVPAALAAVVHRAMAKDPASRYPSAAAFRDALSSATPHEVTAPATVVLAHRQRRRWPFVLVPALLLAVVLAAVVIAQRGGSTPKQSAAANAPAHAVTSTTAAVRRSKTTSAPKAAPAGVTVESTTRSYYSLLNAGRDDDAFAMLTPQYQAASGGIGGYRGFWGTIRNVETLTATGAGDTCRVTLRYTRNDGSSTVETNTLRLVRAGGGWLIDGYA